MDADSHPDFAVVWSFFNKFGKQLEIEEILITDVVKWISSQANQSSAIVDVMVRLMRKTGMRVDKQRWQKHLVKAAAKVDLTLAAEVQTAGFHSLSVPKKLRLLKFLCEMQFDDNMKFKSVINNEEAEVQRLKPVGRDEDGLVYWHQEDEDLNIRVYVEDEDEDEDSGWKVVCRSKEDVDDLIKKLANEPAGKSKDENSDDEDDDIVETKFQIFLKSQCTSESHDDRGEAVAPKSKDEAMKELQNDVFVKMENKENTDSTEGDKTIDSADLEGSQLKRDGAIKNIDAADTSEIKSKTAAIACNIISDSDQNSLSTAIEIEPPSESVIQQPVKPLQNVEIKMEPERSANVSSKEIKLTEKLSVETKSGTTDDSVSNCEKAVSEISENPKAVSPGDGETEGPSSVQTEEAYKAHDENSMATDDKVDDGISESTKLSEPPDNGKSGDSKALEWSTEKNENYKLSHDEISKGTLTKNDSTLVPEMSCSIEEPVPEAMKVVASVPLTVPLTEELENLEPIDDNNKPSDDNNIKVPVSEQDIKATVVDGADVNRQEAPEVDKTKQPDNSNSVGVVNNDDPTECGTGQSPTFKSNSNSPEVEKSSAEISPEIIEKILPRSTTSHRVSAEDKVDLLDSNDRSLVTTTSDVTSNRADNPDSINLGEKLPENSAPNAEVTKTPSIEKAQERLLESDSVPAEISESDPKPRETLGPTLNPVESLESYPKTTELSGSGLKPTELLGSDPKPEEMSGCGPKSLELLDSCQKATELSCSDPGSMELSAVKPVEISGLDVKHAVMPSSAQNTVELVTEAAEQNETFFQPNSTDMAGNGEVCVSEMMKTQEVMIRNGEESKQDNNEEGEDKEGKKNVESGGEEEEMKTKKPTPRKKGKRKRGRATSKRRRAQTTIKKPRDRTPKERKPKLSRLELLKVEAESILHLGEKKSNGGEDEYRTRSGRRVKTAKKDQPEVWQTVGDFGAIDNTKRDSEGDEDFEYVEKKKGRTSALVTPVKEIKRIVNNDTPCMKCGLFSHPETILLCDSCDKGHHMACLTPPLMIVPDEEWFCPKCSKEKLIAKLKKIYDELDSKQKLHQRKSRQTEYKKILNDYTGISTTNIISNPPKPEKRRPAPKKRRRSYSSNSDSDDLIDDKSYSSPSSPELKLTRRCREKQVSYDFSTFDKTIMDAIGEDIHAKPEEPDERPISGKDIRTIIAAEKGEDAKDLIDEKDDVIPGKRKKRNLTNLNSSEDEAVESGSHYSVSESEEEIEEEFRDSNNTDSEGSLTGGRRRRSARGKKKPYVKPTKRSKRLRRKRIQEDYETSLSESSTDYEDAPKQKKAKKRTKWNDYGRESSEEEYVPPRAVRDSKFIDDDDERETEKEAERPKRQRVVKSSSDEDDNEQKDKNDNTEQKENDKEDAENDNEQKDKTKQKESDKKDGAESSDDWSSLSSNAAVSSEEASASESENTKPEGTTTQT